MKKYLSNPVGLAVALLIGVGGTVLYFNNKMKKAQSKMAAQGLPAEQIASFCK